jgi:hypothetical protein
MKHVKTSLFTAVGTAVLALLAGCASQPPATPQDIVRARAQERIDLVHNKDYDKAYGYLLPSYRKLNDAGTWGRRFGNGAKWVDPKVASVKCTETHPDHHVRNLAAGRRPMVVLPALTGCIRCETNSCRRMLVLRRKAN